MLTIFFRKCDIFRDISVQLALRSGRAGPGRFFFIINSSYLGENKHFFFYAPYVKNAYSFRDTPCSKPHISSRFFSNLGGGVNICRLLICFSGHLKLTITTEKHFLAIFWRLNHRCTRLYSFSALNRKLIYFYTEPNSQ